MTGKTVILASPRGFCAGVRHAVEIAEAALRLRPRPLYALNEIVHNRQVVESFERRGVRFVRGIDEVPEGRSVLFSAHGVPPAVRAAAAARRLEVIDATCPFVLRFTPRSCASPATAVPSPWSATAAMTRSSASRARRPIG